jgi:hypothetical protein
VVFPECAHNCNSISIGASPCPLPLSPLSKVNRPSLFALYAYVYSMMGADDDDGGDGDDDKDLTSVGGRLCASA